MDLSVNMLPWLILTAVLFLVIAGLIIERAVSGYLHRKELALLRKESANARAAQDEGFANLGDVQRSLFKALGNAYEAQERAYKFVADQIRVTDEKLGTERKPVKRNESEQWADVIGETEE